MKGLQPLFLGIFGIFAFSWLGMTVVPNLQIGSLDPQTDEEGTDIYPCRPPAWRVRGAEVYAANGCVYCHTQQVRPEYGGSDLERKWGERRSAPRDYIFQPVVLLGKMRTGPDLANVGHRPVCRKRARRLRAPAGAAAAGSCTRELVRPQHRHLPLPTHRPRPQPVRLPPSRLRHPLPPPALRPAHLPLCRPPALSPPRTCPPPLRPWSRTRKH